MQFLRPRPGLSARLSEMRDCGLLGAIFPEFDEISCRVTRDFYHKYTVDEHTLLTVRNVERLLNHPRFGPVLRELRQPELLVLALLYHDVGKAREGHHSEVGADMAAGMMERLQLDEDARHTVDFLIRNHLKMSRIAFRRDTEEPEVVKQFAALFSTEEQLKMLCLLTLADVGAVSPETLTPWKEELLWRLYVDAYNQMTLGYGDEIIDRKEALVAALQAGRPDDITEAEMARFLEGLPRRYLILFSPEAIYRHVRLSRDISAGRGAFLPREEIRRLGADGGLAGQAVSVLEHLRRAVVLRHGHPPRPRADEPVRAWCSTSSSSPIATASSSATPRRASSSTARCATWWPARRDVTAMLERQGAAACCSAAAAGAPHAGHLFRQRALAALHGARAGGR